MHPECLLSECTITVLDYETTGAVSGYPIEPWQVGAARLVNGRLDEKQSFRSFIRTGDRPFNPCVPGRHAENKREILHAPQLPEIWLSLRPWLDGQIVAAHAIATEKKFTLRMAPFHPPAYWIDTLALAKKAWPQEKKFSLEVILQRLGFVERMSQLCPLLAPHDALYDAVGAALLLERLLTLDKWQNLRLADAVAMSSRWQKHESGLSCRSV